MTGRGAAAAAGRLARVEVELSSVNRKQLDVDVGLPRFLAACESRVQELVQSRLSRGLYRQQAAHADSQGPKRAPGHPAQLEAPRAGAG